MDNKHTFATAINCIDGRVQQPLIEWIKGNLHTDYVDMVTEPGPDKILSEENPEIISAIKQKVMVSINAHHSRAIVIAGHYDCAANPVTEKEHIKQINECVENISFWTPRIRIIGAWIDDQWNVNIIRDIKSK